MYANRSARPGRLNPGSLATSLVITGAMIAGLVFAAPDIVRGPGETHMKLENIAPDPVPPIDPPKPLPRTQAQPRPMQPVAPKPLAPVPSTIDPIASDPIVLPLARPTTTIGTGVGPAAPPTAVPTAAEAALVEASVDPRYANALQPAYPPEEQRAGREARLTVRVLVGMDGRVRRIEPLDRGNEAFFASTQRQALTRWRFRPATRGGIPVEAWHTMTVRFVLDRGDG